MVGAKDLFKTPPLFCQESGTNFEGPCSYSSLLPPPPPPFFLPFFPRHLQAIVISSPFLSPLSSSLHPSHFLLFALDPGQKEEEGKEGEGAPLDCQKKEEKKKRILKLFKVNCCYPNYFFWRWGSLKRKQSKFILIAPKKAFLEFG